MAWYFRCTGGCAAGSQRDCWRHGGHHGADVATGNVKAGYSSSQATGICATGTLGQIIPPSIALVLLGDILSSAYQEAQLNMGIFTPKVVSIGDLFVGCSRLILLLMYSAYVMFTVKPQQQQDSEPLASGRLSRAMHLTPIFWCGCAWLHSYRCGNPHRSGGCGRLWCNTVGVAQGTALWDAFERLPKTPPK